MMKILATAGVVLLSSMLLVACGGDSDSSGSDNDDFLYQGQVTIANGNMYVCPSEEALTSCETDSACKAAECDLTKEVTPPSNTQTTTVCNVTGTVITGVQGKSCSFTDANTEDKVVFTCNGSSVEINGKIGNLNSTGSTMPSGTSFSNGYKVVCP